MDNLSIYEALSAVQNDLKAPKGQYNTFGKYNYRSCEDILEAVKPLLKQNSLTLRLSDEPVLIGEWHYIKATATVTDFSGQQISTSAYARECVEKKGMDDSQITGTASSYARKYALNGLFCIDDTKDADTDAYKSQTVRKTGTMPDPKLDPKPSTLLVCACCGKPVQDVVHKGTRIANTKIAKETKEKYGRILCLECAKKQPKENGGLTHA